MTNNSRTLKIETEVARRLLAKLGPIVDGDEQATHDAVEGETSLFEAVDKAIERLLQLDTMQEAIKAQIKTIKGRQERLQAQEEAIRATLLDALTEVGLKKLERPLATLSVANGQPQLLPLNEPELPSRFWTTPDPAPNKVKIRAALLAGEAVPGAQLNKNTPPTLQVRNA